MQSRSRKFTRDFKIKVLREIEGGKSPSQVAREYELHPRLVSKWRKKFSELGERAFSGSDHQYHDTATVAELERKIGQQAMEITFLKKVLQQLETRLRSTRNSGTRS